MPAANFESAVEEDKLRQLLHIWYSHCHAGEIPNRDDIDIEKIPYLLWSNLYMYQRTKDERFRAVFTATGIVASYYREAVGRHLDEMTAWRESDVATRVFLECAINKLPVYIHADSEPFEGTYAPFARLLLPLRGGDGSAQFVFGNVEFFDRVNVTDRPPDKDYRLIIQATKEDIPC